MHQQPPLPQQAKATLLQKFQENLTFHSPEKIAEMALMKECDIEKFAQDNLNLHSKGIFRKKVRDLCRFSFKKETSNKNFALVFCS